MRCVGMRTPPETSGRWTEWALTADRIRSFFIELCRGRSLNRIANDTKNGSFQLKFLFKTISTSSTKILFPIESILHSKFSSQCQTCNRTQRLCSNRPRSDCFSKYVEFPPCVFCLLPSVVRWVPSIVDSAEYFLFSTVRFLHRWYGSLNWIVDKFSSPNPMEWFVDILDSNW